MLDSLRTNRHLSPHTNAIQPIQILYTFAPRHPRTRALRAARLNRRHVPHAMAFPQEGERLQTRLLVRRKFAEDDVGSGARIQKHVEPAIARDHRAGDAEIGEGDVRAR